MSESRPEPATFADEELSTDPALDTTRAPRRLGARLMLLIRRIHLYTGLFLLPWVFLYGVSGAMFNHQELFPEVSIQPVAAANLADSTLAQFPTPEQFARQVLETLQASAGDATITLADDHGAEFTNDVMFEVFESGNRHVVQIDPIRKSAKVVTHPPNDEQPEPLLKDLHYIQLDSDPHQAARASVESILSEVGIDCAETVKPFAWAKLNFLANVNGTPARVTYVLKDGHVDVTRYTGEDGMSPRHFLMRLHAAHGQPPHWNARQLWSLILDAMAIAMVTWGLSGLLMWWQIKRTRLLGGAVIVLSIATATVMYFCMEGFYATTLL